MVKDPRHHGGRELFVGHFGGACFEREERAERVISWVGGQSGVWRTGGLEEV